MWIFLLGMLAGWLTKIPWLKKVYIEMYERQQNIQQIHDNILKNLDKKYGK